MFVYVYLHVRKHMPCLAILKTTTPKFFLTRWLRAQFTNNIYKLKVLRENTAIYFQVYLERNHRSMCAWVLYLQKQKHVPRPDPLIERCLDARSTFTNSHSISCSHVYLRNLWYIWLTVNCFKIIVFVKESKQIRLFCETAH